jgi:hypothetical protein
MTHSQFPAYNKTYNSASTAATTLISSVTSTETLASLYMINASGAVVSHWLALVAGSTGTVAAGDPLMFAWRNPGTDGFQLLLNKADFEGIGTSGFRIIRSATPNTYSTAPVLANNVNIQVTTMFR